MAGMQQPFTADQAQARTEEWVQSVRDTANAAREEAAQSARTAAQQEQEQGAGLLDKTGEQVINAAHGAMYGVKSTFLADKR